MGDKNVGVCLGDFGQWMSAMRLCMSRQAEEGMNKQGWPSIPSLFPSYLRQVQFGSSQCTVHGTIGQKCLQRARLIILENIVCHFSHNM